MKMAAEARDGVVGVVAGAVDKVADQAIHQTANERAGERGDETPDDAPGVGRRAQTASAPPHIVVLGIGNLLWADEGFGVRAVERLHAQGRWPAHVELVDGGTQGLALLPFVEAADRLIVFDAVDFGLAPGTLDVREGDAVPACLNARRMSLHQMGFSDVLACAQLKGHYPQEIVLIGVQPVELDDYGGSLRPAVRAQLDPAAAIAREWLRRWGATPGARVAPGAFNAPASPDVASSAAGTARGSADADTARSKTSATDETDDDDTALNASSLALARYENERPSAQSANRHGDTRFWRPAESS